MVTEAQRQCRESNVSFAETFRFQYVVAPENLELPSFDVEPLGDMFVHIGPDLFAAPLFDKNAKAFGYLLGAASDHEGRDPAGVIAENLDASDADGWIWFENYLSQVSGRYVFLIDIAGHLRAYFDPVGMIGAVYNPTARRLASSPLLTIDDEIVPSAHYDHEAVAEGSGGYGLAHTADARVFRLNANHYLDLKDFGHERFWPKEGEKFSAAEDEYGAIYDEIISASRHVIRGLSERFVTILPLSGGNDSRLLFALAGEDGRREISGAYTHINNYANRRDAAVAALVASKGGMDYEVHDRKIWRAPKFEIRKGIRRWAIGSGINAPAPLEIKNGLFLRVKPEAVVMRGHQTNIMRAQYFNFRDPENSADSKWVLRMLRLAQMPNPEARQYFLDEIQKYKDDLPDCAKVVEADFLFFEALVPAALGMLFQGMGNAFYISPFNSRRLVQLSMQFSTPHKFSNHATHDIIMRAEASLSSLPAANKLPAKMSEDDEIVAQRQDFIESTRQRYEKYFGESAPEVRAEIFDIGPYHAAVERAKAEAKAAEENSPK